ncbi:hypothetical protein NC797_10570 [Aquibacillus sp. 3ASR75-11]|uniref:DUF4190 domain-containing protein n=1 Tax=Terrihalobacillus insolitus TaxID=2950438 RepID=A0A9X3WX72_9BACI|nr:hypothetical protein [Terrihalobacillus insolitus]MDC3413371.1 hypothetical protein [Terrihalobacillus insolitus]MDC3424954.1 hypothetical protein [Terrihalobacillus insolitus]
MDDKHNYNIDDVEESPPNGDEVPAIRNRQQGAQSTNTFDDTLDHRSGYEEELGQEMTADDVDRPIKSDEQETKMQSNVHTGMGWLAVILSALSFFVMPVILGAAGIIFGFVSKNRGADTLGNTAIIAGAIAIVLSLFVRPFV